MSGSGPNARNAVDDVAEAGSRLVDSAGAPLRSGARQAAAQAQGQAEQLTTFIHEQPVAAVLIGVMVGYLLGKIV